MPARYPLHIKLTKQKQTTVMKKKSVVGWMFIAVFTLLGIGCVASMMWNKVLAFYAVGFFCLAWMLYRSDD